MSPTAKKSTAIFRSTSASKTWCRHRATAAAVVSFPLRRNQMALAPLGQGHEVASVFADVNLARAGNLLVGVYQHLLPLRQPAHRSRNTEQYGELVGREAHGLVDDARIEVDVGEIGRASCRER